MSARGFLWRWSLRTLRRERRQHLGVFALVAAAVALSVGSIVAAFNLAEPPGFRYGAGNVRAEVVGSGTDALDQLAGQDVQFGAVQSASVDVPGKKQRVEIRRIDPDDAMTEPLLALVDGTWPQAPDEIAVTDGAPTAQRALGSVVELAGAARTVVGVVENPTDLTDEFVLVDSLDSFGIEERFRTTVLLVQGDPEDVTLPAGTANISLEDRGAASDPSARTLIAIAVSLVSAVAMCMVALLIGAAFAVIARRRAREHGLLAAAGATPRQIRLAVSFTGLVLGVVAAALGVVLGILVVAALVPRMEGTVNHRIDLAVPVWSVVPTFLLATAAATVAAWWPSRVLSRQPIVEVLASLRPQPSSTGGTRLGLVAAAAGTVVLAIGTWQLSALLVIAGIVVALGGLLLLSPALVRVIGRSGGRLPLAGRLAARAIARRQGRSAAVVAALVIALAVPVGVAVVTASIDRHSAAQPLNLADDTAIAWTPGVAEEQRVVPVDAPATDLDLALARIRNVAPDAEVVPVEVAVDPASDARAMTFPRLGTVAGVETTFGIRPADPHCGATCEVNSLGDRDAEGNEITLRFHDAWVATPELLAVLGIDARHDDPAAQAISRFTDAKMSTHRDQSADLASNVGFEPTVPPHTSIAGTLIWPDTVTENGWRTSTVGFLMVGAEPFTADQLVRLSQAAGGDLLVESTVTPQASTSARVVGIAVGALVVLGILLAALGLLGADAADDMRILQSIGASPGNHRRLSAATAAILTGAGALIALPTGYLALVVLLADRTTDYGFVIPWLSLLTITVLLPLLAAGIGWATSRTHTTRLAAPR